MIFCHCAGVTDNTIARVIEAGATSVDEIVRCCGAGRYCDPCREELAALLVSLGSQQQPDPVLSPVDGEDRAIRKTPAAGSCIAPVCAAAASSPQEG